MQQICEETSVNNDGFDSTEVSISKLVQYITQINTGDTYWQYFSPLSYAANL